MAAARGADTTVAVDCDTSDHVQPGSPWDLLPDDIWAHIIGCVESFHDKLVTLGDEQLVPVWCLASLRLHASPYLSRVLT